MNQRGLFSNIRRVIRRGLGLLADLVATAVTRLVLTVLGGTGV